jgi:hypothetical protein
MFPYQDPTSTDFLQSQGALQEYRNRLDFFYRFFARVPNSAFTLLDAFKDLTPDTSPTLNSIPWLAFPRTASASFEEIDSNRFRFQDEYVEWRTETQAGQVTRVTFTTEFPEYYEALAAMGVDALIAGIREVISEANPTTVELFGQNFNPETATGEARAGQFRFNLENNPWNNGEKGILCLTQGFNTMNALFNLVAECAIPKPGDSSDVCGAVGGACGPGRNSDPVICKASQDLARSSRALSLLDPVGIKITRLRGIWKINNQQVDINDPIDNQGAWIVSRNGRRAVLDVTKGVTIGDEIITTGTQVATALEVSADVISAPENAIPTWARTGQEEFLRANR